MANRRKKRAEEQSDLAVSQSEGKRSNDDRDENRAGIDSSNMNASKQSLLEKLVMKMMAKKLNAKKINAKVVKRCQAKRGLKV